MYNKLNDPNDPGQYSPTMQKINNYVTIISLLGGIVGYGLVSINL